MQFQNLERKYKLTLQNFLLILCQHEQNEKKREMIFLKIFQNLLEMSFVLLWINSLQLLLIRFKKNDKWIIWKWMTQINFFLLQTHEHKNEMFLKAYYHQRSNLMKCSLLQWSRQTHLLDLSRKCSIRNQWNFIV